MHIRSGVGAVCSIECQSTASPSQLVHLQYLFNLRRSLETITLQNAVYWGRAYDMEWRPYAFWEVLETYVLVVGKPARGESV